MSLKSLHLVFVFCTGMLSVFLAVWNYLNWVSFGFTSSLVYMGLSLISGAAVIYYGKQFLNKFKSLSFM